MVRQATGARYSSKVWRGEERRGKERRGEERQNLQNVQNKSKYIKGALSKLKKNGRRQVDRRSEGG